MGLPNAELKTCVRARRPTNLTQLHQLYLEEWAKIHPTYCGKVVSSNPRADKVQICRSAPEQAVKPTVPRPSLKIRICS